MNLIDSNFDPDAFAASISCRPIYINRLSLSGLFRNDLPLGIYRQVFWVGAGPEDLFIRILSTGRYHRLQGYAFACFQGFRRVLYFNSGNCILQNLDFRCGDHLPVCLWNCSHSNCFTDSGFLEFYNSIRIYCGKLVITGFPDNTGIIILPVFPGNDQMQFSADCNSKYLRSLSGLRTSLVTCSRLFRFLRFPGLFFLSRFLRILRLLWLSRFLRTLGSDPTVALLSAGIIWMANINLRRC